MDVLPRSMPMMLAHLIGSNLRGLPHRLLEVERALQKIVEPYRAPWALCRAGALLGEIAERIGQLERAVEIAGQDAPNEQGPTCPVARPVSAVHRGNRTPLDTDGGS